MRVPGAVATRHSTILLAALILGPRLVLAQVCLGHTPFAGGLVKAGAGTEFGNGTTAIWAGGSLGRVVGIFGGGALGLVSGGGESGSRLSMEAGKQLAKPIRGKLVLCPMARLGLQFGPSEYYERNFILAVMAAYPIATAASATRFNLVGGFQGAYQRFPRFTGINGKPVGSHQWYGLLDLGVGVTFNRSFSLIPQLRIPLGHDGRDPSLIIRGSVNLGGSR